MSSVSLYRKYRPSVFSEVLGQEHIVSVLETSIKNNKVGHAYLFSGTRGTGKTSIARIFAKELGTAPEDIIELDAASNRRIDDIREIRDGVNTFPFSSKYKVYIIDEVHMLTTEAFNALLKTLEEPPAHVIFILATTELDKVPDTILSRCESYRFKTPTTAILKDVVLSVSEKEGYVVDQSTAETIALLGDGSFRDTLGTLQKILVISKDKKIDPEEVTLITGAPNQSLINEFLESLIDRDQERALSIVKKAENNKMNPELFLRLSLEKFRTILLLRIAPTTGKTFAGSYSVTDQEVLNSLSEKKSSVLVSKSLGLFLYTDERIKKISLPWTLFDLLVMEILEDNK